MAKKKTPKSKVKKSRKSGMCACNCNMKKTECNCCGMGGKKACKCC